MVPKTIAEAVGFVENPDTSWSDVLVGDLKARELLLVLDNCEHLLDALAPLVVRLLEVSAGLQVVATSREPLQVEGETRWPVPPLQLPEESASPEMAAAATDAVQLFAKRAAEVQSGFSLDTDTVETATAVCRRLDGIPLAIELAAARMNMFSARQVAERVEDRFSFLTGGLRTALPRHRTLEATLDWSYDLLDTPEQMLLRRLGVFAGRVHPRNGGSHVGERSAHSGRTCPGCCRGWWTPLW